MQSNETVDVTRAYYNSDDADSFYATIWGGEDIHIGLYEESGESIFDASRRTVERMAGKVADRLPGARILDLGAGYGGSARYLASRFPDCHVDCLNLSEVQNERNRKLNAEQGLADRIGVIDGSFEDVPAEDGGYDLVWSQDAFLHSGDRSRVLREVDRVLKQNGTLILTDPMQKEEVQPDEIRPVLDRIHLETMGSIPFYKRELEALGFQVEDVEELTHQLVRHYSSVRQQIVAHDDALARTCSRDYIERMKAGLQHWVDAGQAGKLEWGILVFVR